MVMFNALQSILSIIILISLGYLLTRAGWFNEEISKLFSKLVTTISLPALMIVNFTTTFDKKTLIQSSSGLVIPFASIFLCFIISSIMAYYFVADGRRGTFEALFSVSNTIFIGLPVNIALFGEQSIPYALVYYIANTFFFWVVAVFKISRDGNIGQIPILSKQTIKAILSPPLLGFLAGAVLVLGEIRLPAFILDTCKYLGNLTTPLSLLFIGITFYSIDPKILSFNRDMFLVFLGRFFISPAIVYLLAIFFPIPPLMLKVFIIQSAMPVMAQTAIISKTYGADHEYATIMISATTLASAFFIPVYMSILSLF
ncbi:AEC family transporter [Geosporobacter ferrireducens]|uniref:Malate transporter n=1 Tax=Geosporobacter ferrireducens TaxID=1424294 RepID=A0A1D8GHJ8_9FIRM|nr:AEC family transporter [Geosporobacter ferrireducens]AOT70401.1 malate transporter [Geosporobacter ferrireducens]MTI58158.1 AEC family transporter [Geosporobacter ferrireducens]